jgi:type IV pilus assembly protein PilF
MLRAIFCSLLVLSLAACVSEPRDPSFMGAGAFDTKEAAKTRVSLGLTYLQNGNFAQAKFNLDKALEFAPRDGQAHFAMAFYYQQVGEFERAEESYEKALSFSKNDPDVLNSYGAFLCQQGNYDKAKGYFLRAVDDRNYVSSAETYENLALCSQSQGNNQEAIQYFNSALNHQPTRSDSLFLLSKLYVEEEQWEDAKKTLFKYERTAPISAESLYLQFQIAEGMKDTKTAMGYGEILKSMYPDHPNTKAYIASMGKFRPAASITRKERQPSRLSSTPELTQSSPSSSPQAITIIDTTKEVADNTTNAATTAATASVASAVTSTDIDPEVMSAPIEQQAEQEVEQTFKQETEENATLKAAAEATAALISQVTQPRAAVPDASQATLNDSVSVSNETMESEESDLELEQGSEIVPIADDAAPQIINQEASITGLAPKESEVQTQSEIDEAPDSSNEQIDSQSAAQDSLASIEQESEAALASMLDSSEQPIAAELSVEDDVAEAELESYAIQASEEVEAIAEPALDELLDKDDESVVEASEAEMQEAGEAQEIMSEDPEFHIVLPQENLYRISLRYNVKMSRLLEWNDLKDASDIRIGSKLRVKAPDNNE